VTEVAVERVTVSVADGADFSTVVDALRRAGLTVTEPLETLGVVTGTVERDTLAALSAVPGVSDVERQYEIQLPPPDAPVQ
jgi:hypothetical protein